MKTVELQATVRTEKGKIGVKKVRAVKQIPAIVYGHKSKPLSIQIDYKSFDHVIHTGAGENVIINLKVKGEKTLDENVIIKEIQHHPVTESIRHVDFNIISMTEKIKVNVRLVAKGESLGVKAGGVLDIVHHEIEVECLPTQIPEKLEADISNLQIGDSIHIKDLAFPQGVVSQLDADEVVIAIHAPKAEEVAAPAEEGAKEPEVIGKAKEEGAEGEEAPAAAPAAEGKKEKAEGK